MLDIGKPIGAKVQAEVDKVARDLAALLVNNAFGPSLRVLIDAAKSGGPLPAELDPFRDAIVASELEMVALVEKLKGAPA